MFGTGKRFCAYLPRLEALEERATPAGLHLSPLLASVSSTVEQIVPAVLSEVQVSVGADVTQGHGVAAGVDVGNNNGLHLALGHTHESKGDGSSLDVELKSSVGNGNAPLVKVDVGAHTSPGRVDVDVPGGNGNGNGNGGVHLPPDTGTNPPPPKHGNPPPTNQPPSNPPTGKPQVPPVIPPDQSGEPVTLPPNVPSDGGVVSPPTNVPDAATSATLASFLRVQPDTTVASDTRANPSGAGERIEGNTTASSVPTSAGTVTSPIPAGADDNEEEAEEEDTIPDADVGPLVTDFHWTPGGITGALDRLFSTTGMSDGDPTALAWKLSPALLFLTALTVERWRRPRSRETESMVAQGVLGFPDF